MLRVTDLTYTYPESERPALRDITFELEAGQVLLLVGATGSGKSTLCYALGGFAPHFFNGEISGDVLLDGRSMRKTPLGEWVQQVGLVLQNPFNQLSGARLTVFEEVAFGLENLGVPRAEMGPRVRAALAQLEIEELAERSPYALSGGQMQRVAIASILVLQPRLLVLDEPTAQLDPQGSAELFALLRTLTERGTTIVLATHDLAQAAPLAAQTLVLHRGRVALQGETRAILSDARLPEWGVDPPLYTILAARLGLPPPHPMTLGEAAQCFSMRISVPVVAGATVGAGLAPAPTVPPTRVVVDEVRFAYPGGVEALRGVSLRLEPGQLTALIGANGAGKSTLSRTLNGLLRPDSGTIMVGAWDVTAQSASRTAARVGYLFQNPDDQLFKATVQEEVAFAPQALGFDEARTRRVVAWAIEMVGLREVAQVHPYDLHPSQRRWVALASVLAQQAPVLLLDEPTSGQDRAGKQRLAALLATLRAAGYTLLLISHDMAFVAEHAEHLLVMAAGEIIAQGSPATIFADDEVLQRAGVAPPPVTQLAHALGVAQTPLTVQQLLAVLTTPE